MNGAVELPEFRYGSMVAGHREFVEWTGRGDPQQSGLSRGLVALALAVPLAFVIAPDAWKRLALIAVILFLVIVELLNTAIEKLADHVTPALHPGIGRIKDMGSAAVGVALFLAAAIWLVAIGERLAIL